jgi:hypothetical protein
MLSRRTARRKCREHEREWNGLCVDKNLEDDWLVRLNNLETFSLISICEGHCSRQTDHSRTSPHIKLRLKEQFLPGIARRWDENKMAVVSQVNKRFDTGDTFVNLELKFKLRSGAGRMTYQEDLILQIHSRRARIGEEMDIDTRDWFERCVSEIESLDSLCTQLWNGEDQET